MAATLQDIKGWYDRAKREGATHFIVVCDAFDYEDYPVLVMPGEDVRAKVAQFDGSDMLRIMEVYSMKMSWASQSQPGARVFNLD